MDNLGRTVKMVGRKDRQGVILEHPDLPSPISVSVARSRSRAGVLVVVVADPKVRIRLNNATDAWHGNGDASS